MPKRARTVRYRRSRSLLQNFVVLAVGAIAIVLVGVTSRERSAEGASVTGAETPVIAGVASVIDGDTIEVHGERIRLKGVDAPEARQQCLDGSGQFYRCGSAAANALDAWINGNPVSCTANGKDRYGRTIASCLVRGESVNAWMVRSGHALAYRQYSTALVAEEEAARAEGAGLWRGRFIEPWSWRKGERLDGEQPATTKAVSKVASAEGPAANLP